MLLALVISVAAAVLGALVLRLVFEESRSSPGPKKHVLLGNLWDIPKSREWEAYMEMGKRLASDNIHLQFLGRHLLVLNSFESAMELLDNRGALYSDRPRLIFIRELCGWAWNTVLMPIGPLHSAHRAYFKQYFDHDVVARDYQSHIAQSVQRLLKKLLVTPQTFRTHIKLSAVATIMMITYGQSVSSEDDPFLAVVEAVRQAEIAWVQDEPFLVDFFPLAKYIPEWFPGTKFHRHAKRGKKASEDMLRLPFDVLKRKIANGTALPCMALSMLESNNRSTATDMSEMTMDCTGTIYSAGADTNISALLNFVLLMQLHPEVQGKAQAEIDAVTGGTRLPDFSDREALPYVNCVIKETLRWMPPTPMGVPHRLLHDDGYRGKVIPKGTIVISNIWGILHDEKTYRDPHTFNPERFLGSDENPLGEADPTRVVFGFGRRRCPGRHFAEHSLFLTIAQVLSVFSISKALDERGKEITPVVTWSSGLISAPSDFECLITPRHGDGLSLIDDNESLL